MKKIFLNQNLLLLCIMLFPVMSYSKQKVFVTSVNPPYQKNEDGVLSGSTIQQVKCVMENIGSAYEFELFPLSRAILNVKNGKAEGIFTLAKSKVYDEVMHSSWPIAIEKWFWIFKADEEKTSGKNKKIGAINGSSQEKWLIENGYEVAMKANNEKHLFELLKADRINTYVADIRAFQENADGLDKVYNKTFIKYVPLHVYFNSSFAAENKTFIDQFNKNIFNCNPPKIVLSIEEKNEMKKFANTFLNKNILIDSVIDKIKQQNIKHKDITLDEIKLLDSQWRMEVKSDSMPLVDSLLTNDISSYLMKIKEEYKGVFNEIIIMDKYGLNAGQSDITSDYWQGDEAKFKKTYELNTSEIFIDDISFDQSSSHYTVQVSLSIPDKNNELIGAITLGINIENL